MLDIPHDRDLFSGLPGRLLDTGCAGKACAGEACAGGGAGNAAGKRPAARILNFFRSVCA